MSSEDISAQQQAQGGGQEGDQRRIQLRDTGVSTNYANFFTISGGRDAILFSFGNQFGQQNMVQLEDKVVLSPRNAKRLAVSLGGVIRRYEQQHGEIEIGQQQQQQQAPGQAEEEQD